MPPLLLPVWISSSNLGVQNLIILLATRYLTHYAVQSTISYLSLSFGPKICENETSSAAHVNILKSDTSVSNMLRGLKPSCFCGDDSPFFFATFTIGQC